MGTIEQQTKTIMHHTGTGILGMMLSTLGIIFVTAPSKLVGLVLETTTFVNPQAKQLIMDLAPFIGAGTGILLAIVYIYKIRIYRKTLKDMNEKKNNEK